MKNILQSLLIVFLCTCSLTSYAKDPTIIHRLTVNNPISPAMEEYFSAEIKHAEESGAAFILLHLDTPGGTVSAMRGMIKAMGQSYVPIITFVTPSGAQAASAGTFLVYASHVAAMSPGTNLGAATPINLGSQSEKKSAAVIKAEQNLIATIQSLSQKHKRDTKHRWFKKAVTEGSSLSASEALEKGVIELIAQNEQDLLEQLDGRTIDLQEKSVTLSTKNAIVVDQQPNWRIRILAIITNPNIAYGLLMLGIYGILFELYHPGTFISGTVGIISITLAAYGLHLLPVSAAGLTLLLLGVALLVGEVFTGGFGLLGIGGTVSFLFGSLLLFDPVLSGWGLSLWMIGFLTATSALLIVAMGSFLWRLRRRKIVSGIETLIGQTGVVTHVNKHYLEVSIRGERWQAKADQRYVVGQSVRVSSIDGLILKIKPSH